jgi:hypothetical protein
LDAFRAEFVRKTPPGRAELYDAKVDELRRQFPIGAALKTGDKAPDFTLPDALGRPVSLAERLKNGPVVVTFYRGGWSLTATLKSSAPISALCRRSLRWAAGSSRSRRSYPTDR